MGVSAYESGSGFDRKMSDVVGKIRSYSGYRGTIKVVRGGGSVENW